MMCKSKASATIIVDGSATADVVVGLHTGVVPWQVVTTSIPHRENTPKQKQSNIDAVIARIYIHTHTPILKGFSYSILREYIDI